MTNKRLQEALRKALAGELKMVAPSRLDCPICGLTYDEFRTGHDYRSVYYMCYNRPYKRRNTVLGYWRQVKIELWEQHLVDCERYQYEIERDNTISNNPDLGNGGTNTEY